MDIRFLFPWGAVLCGIAALAITAGFLLITFREAKVAAAFRRPYRSRGSMLADATALILALMLFVTAVARPVLVINEGYRVRNDVAVLYLFDVSRSMAARPSWDNPDRISRAKTAAAYAVGDTVEFPSGVAAFTNVVMPHQPVTTFNTAVQTAVTEFVQIDSIPANYAMGQITSSFWPMTKIVEYFPDDATRKILVVFTDGKMDDYQMVAPTTALLEAGITVIMVGVGNNDERVPLYDVAGRQTRVFDTEYVPIADYEYLGTFTSLVSGTLLQEPKGPELASAIRDAAGNGPSTPLGDRNVTVEIAPLVFVLAIVPSLFFARRLELFSK